MPDEKLSTSGLCAGSKRSIADLAYFGGPQSFSAPLHVGRPNIGDRTRLMARINDLLDRRWLSNNGPYVQELETRIAAMLGVRHCIAVANGTIALEIAIRALGLTGEVLVPSFTFIATAHALQWQQITPVFCDIDPRTHSIDPGTIEQMITPRTSGIIGVHVWGEPCAIDELTAIAARRGLKLLFDASHAFNCSHRGERIGGFGLAEVFSFHATKYFNTFEGGAVTTNSDDLAAKIRLMKNFGFAGYDNVIFIGTNGKMSEICAAMGLTGLEQLDDFIAVNRDHYETYRQLLDCVPGIALYRIDANERRNYQHIVVEIDAQQTGISRDLLLRILHAENVLARRYFYPGCHRMEPYRSYFPHARLLLPVTEHLCERIAVLPTGTAVTRDEIAAICDTIRFAALNGPDITRRFRSAT
jgi:dTDP-4-amino-4,6-dideoxygalactose transaminase